jgi:DNA (cytosine-5)-methyltransferase 1
LQSLIEGHHKHALKLPFEEAARETHAPARNPYLKRLDGFAKSKLSKSRFNLISLFCGGGGLDLGLGFAGFKSLVVSDITPAFVETVTTNLPHAQGLVIDAMELTAEQLQEKAGTKDIDLVAAGPPCQAFSVLGRRGALDDPRGKLALKYFGLVAEIKPKAFMFENVPGLMSVNKGEDWKKLLSYAKDITGYHLYFAKLNAAWFGIPQQRERVIVIGFRERVAFQFPLDKFPSGIGALEFLKDGYIPSPSRWALEEVDGLPNHVIRPHGARVSQRYAAIPQGGRDKTDHTDRIDPTRPSRTVLVGSSAGGGRPHIHPDEHRVITVREAARLQSFPDWYVFHGASTAQYRQTGNAVPPLLAYEVGRKISESLEQF